MGYQRKPGFGMSMQTLPGSIIDLRWHKACHVFEKTKKFWVKSCEVADRIRQLYESVWIHCLIDFQTDPPLLFDSLWRPRHEYCRFKDWTMAFTFLLQMQINLGCDSARHQAIALGRICGFWFATRTYQLQPFHAQKSDSTHMHCSGRWMESWLELD